MNCLIPRMHNNCFNTVVKGRTIRKVMGGGGGGGSKNKNRAEEIERKKIRAPKKFEKKNSCRDFSIRKINS